jgi:hypothetical protein
VHDVLRCLRAGLQRDAIDRGPEPEAMYESDMQVYVGKGNPEVEANITTKRPDNPSYVAQRDALLKGLRVSLSA